MANSKDVAKRAGVSVATISRVYQSPQLVRPETRELVLQVAKELDYYPNLVARSLKQSRSNSIGIAVNDFTNPFFFQIIEQIQMKLEQTDYQLLTFSPSGKSFSNHKVTRYLRSNQIDAFLFSPFFHNKEDLRFLNASKQYLLQLYTDYYEDIDSIIINDRYGTYLATRYLLERGHRTILLLNAAMEERDVRDEGYIQAYEEAGLTADPDGMLHCVNLHSMMTPIRDRIQQLKPTAMICHSESITIRALSVLKDMKLNFPEDMSIITYDDHPWAEIMGITAIAQPIAQVGQTIAATVLDALNAGKDRPVVKLKIKPELIERNSVRDR